MKKIIVLYFALFIFLLRAYMQISGVLNDSHTIRIAVELLNFFPQNYTKYVFYHPLHVCKISERFIKKLKINGSEKTVMFIMHKSQKTPVS